MSDTLERLQKEIAELKSLAPRWLEQQNGSTHWDTCWQDHRSCALAKVEEQQKEIERLEKALNERNNRGTGFLYVPKAAYDAQSVKLAAMEEVVEAAKLLASKWFRMLTKSWICDGCDGASDMPELIPHRPDCPVGIVLSFTKKKEAGR